MKMYEGVIYKVGVVCPAGHDQLVMALFLVGENQFLGGTVMTANQAT